jgi:hypothetical protein
MTALRIPGATPRTTHGTHREDTPMTAPITGLVVGLYAGHSVYASLRDAGLPKDLSTGVATAVGYVAGHLTSKAVATVLTGIEGMIDFVTGKKPVPREALKAINQHRATLGLPPVTQDDIEIAKLGDEGFVVRVRDEFPEHQKRNTQAVPPPPPAPTRGAGGGAAAHGVVHTPPTTAKIPKPAAAFTPPPRVDVNQQAQNLLADDVNYTQANRQEALDLLNATTPPNEKNKIALCAKFNLEKQKVRGGSYVLK